jgi:hypothetical protein
MLKKFVIIIAAIFCVLVVIAGIMVFMRARNTSSAESCINKLRQIDAATQQWAFENSKTTNDIPTWDIVVLYMKGQKKPVCPNGGTYTLGSLTENPTCSIGGTSHTLP